MSVGQWFPTKLTRRPSALGIIVSVIVAAVAGYWPLWWLFENLAGDEVLQDLYSQLPPQVWRVGFVATATIATVATQARNLRIGVR